MRFPYQIHPGKPDAAFPTRTENRRPILRIQLERQGKSILSLALVDSERIPVYFPPLSHPS